MVDTWKPTSSVLETLTNVYWSFLKKSFESHINIHSVVDDRTLIADDSSLVTLMRLDGAKGMMGDAELEEFIKVAVERLGKLFSKRGHILHVVFERNPEAGYQEAKRQIDILRKQASRVDLDLDDLLYERQKKLQSALASETVILACWTRPSALDKFQLKRDRIASKKTLKNWLSRSDKAQCPHRLYESMPAIHNTMIDAMQACCAESGIVLEPLDCVSALRTMKRFINGPELVSDTWVPDIPGGIPRLVRVRGDGVEGVHSLPLVEQLLAIEPEVRGNILKMNNRLYAPLDVNLGPSIQDNQSISFDAFIARIREHNIPVRFSILLESDGFKSGFLKRAAASAFAATNYSTRLLNDSFKELEHSKAQGEAILRIRMNLLTWTTSENEQEIFNRRAKLIQAASSWKQMETTALIGDPLQTFASTVPGINFTSSAEAGLIPLSNALALLPWQRPAMAFETGTQIFISPDGKIQPTRPRNNSKYCLYLMDGRSGQGKSVLLNTTAIAFCLEEGLAELPLIATINIGPSSKGFISLLNDALPLAKRHLVGHYPLQNTKNFAINPCDTQLGCRYPVTSEKFFLINILSLLFSRQGGEGMADGILDAIVQSIDEIYRLRAGTDPITGELEANAELNSYHAGYSPIVDTTLKKHNIHLPDEPKWWDIVDILFDIGEMHAAGAAQKHAIPTFNDLTLAIQSSRFQSLFANTKYGNSQESLTSAFNRIITAAASKYPILFNITQFDLSDVRIAAVDLGAVAHDGSEEGDRLTTIMYMLARHALVHHWWLTKETLLEIPVKFREFHQRRFRKIIEIPKALRYDEFHRTAKSPSVVAQVIRDAREIRKVNVSLTLVSQSQTDFPEKCRQWATSSWFLGTGGTVKELEDLESMFDLSDTLAHTVKYNLTGPTSKGTPVLLLSGIGKGRYEKLLYNLLGPIELWALSTEPDDVALRERLYDLVPPKIARRLLAINFPNGSIGDEVKIRRLRFENQGKVELANDEAVLDQLAEELKDQQFKLPPIPEEINL